MREIARTFGSVVTRTQKGKTYHGLRSRIDGEEFYSWAVPVGSRWISYVSRDMTEGVLDEVRSDIRRAIDSLAAISPYVRNSPIYEFSSFWGEWVEFQRARAQRGEISHERARVVGGHEGRGYLEPIWHESVFVLDYGRMEALQAHSFAIEREDGRKLSPKSVHRVLAHVRACLKCLSRRRGFPTAPTSRAPRCRATSLRFRPWTSCGRSSTQSRRSLEGSSWPVACSECGTKRLLEPTWPTTTAAQTRPPTPGTSGRRVGEIGFSRFPSSSPAG